MARSWLYLIATTSVVALSGCQVGQMPDLKQYNPFKAAADAAAEPEAQVGEVEAASDEVASLATLIASADAKVNVDAGFASAMKSALASDPYVLSAKSDAAALKARVRTTTSQKDINFDATILGGIEDVSQETAGVAGIFRAKRMLFDGGRLDAQIAGDTFAAEAADHTVAATQNERAVTLAHAWIELERYRELKTLIDSRLEVLDPLLAQLESVVNSGVGDASQIAAAQRTVSVIRVTQTDVTERYEQAKLDFVNLFGKLPTKSTYNAAKLSAAVPSGKASVLAEKAPALLARYAEYRAAEARLASVKAQDNFNVGFEAKLQKPLGGSDYSSDESVGLVITRTLFKGDQLTSQIDNADSNAKAKAEQVRSTYVVGERALNSARQMISSMDKAIALSRDNARIARDEIAYLRKQLIIGGSTLDSVLGAEARLYEAESKEIGFRAERRKAEATILGTTGLLAKAVGVQ